MTPSKIFLYICISFICGIFLRSLIKIPQLMTLGILIFGLTLISVFWRYKKLAVLGFCILFLVLGVWRHQKVESGINNNELINYNDKEQEITLIGIVSAEPDVRENNIRLAIKPENIDGRVLVTTRRYPEYRYGDKLKITGKFKTPVELEDFNYKDYLTKDGIYSVMDWPKIEIIERNQGNFVYAKIFELKNKLRESIYQNLSPPQSSILGALILGDKRKIPEDLKEKLNIAGIRHITAISGLHVAILTSILMTLLIGFGFWRQQAFYFAIISISIFIIMTGLQPSSIRAGIMGGLFLLAQYLGRMSVSSRVVFFAGTVMLAKNPLLLRFDIGFQLSFLAVMGIIYLGPIFRSWLKFIPEEKFINFRSLISLTLAAQVFTLPILIYNFGYFSIVAPITNVLILPFLPYIMGLGFIFAFSGIIWNFLGWLLSWPSWLILTYLIKVVDFFSQIPGAALNLRISWIWLIIFYLVLGLIAWRLQEKEKLKFLNY